MNTTDLRDVLDERSSDAAEQVMHHLRLHGVQAKVRRRRRRRVAAWTACVVVALAGVASTVALPGPRPTPDTPGTIRMIEGFPEYANGARVVGAASSTLPERRTEVAVVTSTLDLTVFTRCGRAGDNVEIMMKVTVNGHLLTEGTCGGAASWPNGPDPDVTAGKAATFVMTITGAERFDGTNSVPAAMPATGAFGLAIGEAVPFDRYPLPPRPAGPLAPLHALPGGCTETLCPDSLIIRSDPADPSRSIRRTLTWKTISDIDMAAQTPGLLHLRVTGVEIATGNWWDYEQGGYGMYGDQNGGWKKEFGLDPRPGDQVTIEIIPEHLTGAWQVVLKPAA